MSLTLQLQSSPRYRATKLHSEEGRIDEQDGNGEQKNNEVSLFSAASIAPSRDVVMIVGTDDLQTPDPAVAAAAGVLRAGLIGGVVGFGVGAGVAIGLVTGTITEPILFSLTGTAIGSLIGARNAPALAPVVLTAAQQAAVGHVQAAVDVSKLCVGTQLEKNSDFATIEASTLALASAQEAFHVSDTSVIAMRTFMNEKSPGRAENNPAWVNRTIAALIVNGVCSVEDQTKDGHLTRYGINTLYKEGIKRDYGRGVGSALVNYMPSFGLSSALGGASRQVFELGAGPSAYALPLSSAAIGFGQESTGTLMPGIAGLRYTRPPTDVQKEKSNHTAKQTFSFMPFFAFHTALDFAAFALTDTKVFNIGYWRIVTGAAAAVVTGALRADIDMRATRFEPIWMNADNPQMPALIANLKQSTLKAAEEWTIRTLGGNLMGTNLPSTATPHRSIFMRGLARSLLAGMSLNYRFLVADPTINSNLPSLAPREMEKIRLLAFTATNFSLGFWDVVVRTLSKWPVPGQGHLMNHRR